MAGTSIAEAVLQQAYSLEACLEDPALRPTPENMRIFRIMSVSIARIIEVAERRATEEDQERLKRLAYTNVRDVLHWTESHGG
jgi:hypothetical protein